ncbi:hypothetical protein ACFX2J_007725 [Malus domestica]
MDDVEINEAADSDSSGSNSIPTFEYFHYNTREGMAKYITSTGQLSTPAENVRFETFIKGCIQPNDDRFGFVCVTAHFIDSSWMLQKRIIGFRMLEYPHSDCVIFQCMMDIFREYSIDDKVSAITFDNNIHNDAIVDMFRNALHHPNGVRFSDMKCLGHVINSIVQEGLKLMEIRMETLRAVVVYVSSSSRQYDWDTFCLLRGLKRRKFKPDSRSHWNTTYLMLRSLVDYKDAIYDFYNNKPDTGCLIEKDWELCFVFMEFLKVFYEAATTLSSNVYSRSSCFILKHFCFISSTFSEHRDHSGFKPVYEIMESKLRNYCEEMLPGICLAAAMDPRMQLHGVELRLNEISQNLTVPLKADAKSVETLLHNLYKVYESEFAKRKTEGEDEEAEFHSNDYTKRLMAEFHAKLRKKEEQKYGSTELHRYLGMNHRGTMSNQEYVNLDVLEWWKSREGWFPALAVMARDLLTPSVVAIAPEFVFSSAGKQVLDQRRSMQSPKMLDCSFCLKDWEDAELRAQNWTDDMVEYFKDSNQSNVDESVMT